MDRLKVHGGTKQKIEHLFDRIQEFISGNISSRLAKIFSSYGPVTDQLYGAIQSITTLKVGLTTVLDFTIQPGEAIIENGEKIKVSTTHTETLPADAGDIYWSVKLQYTELGSVPVATMNSFVYDKTGTSPYATRNSEFTDNYVVVLTNEGSTGAVSVATNEVALAIIKTDVAGTALETGSWVRDGVTAVSGVIDLRPSYSLKIDPNVLDDEVILFRDRASTGANAFSQNIEFSGTATHSGPVVFSDTANLNLPGVSNTSFKVGVGTLGGGAGVNVLTEGDLPTVPKNFRISDVNPYDKDHQAKVSEVELKWNWVGLTGTASTDTLVIDGVISGEDALELTGLNDLSGYEVFCPNFASSDNKYDISGSTITAAGSTTLTLSGISGGGAEDPDGTYPAEIRSKCDGFTLKLVPKESGDLLAEKARFFSLDDSYNSTQKYTVELPLETTWELSIQSVLSSFSSGFAIMESGTYDPDSTGPLSPIAYASPFYNILPNIDDSGSGITITASAAGWEAAISGWGGTDITDTPHEYEFAWTTADTLDWNDITGVVQRVKQLGKVYNFASDAARAYVVGARPLQNNTNVAVGLEQDGQVVSGGGGALPGDIEAISSATFDIQTFLCDTPVFSGLTPREDRKYIVTPEYSPSVSGVAITSAEIPNVVSYLNNRAQDSYISNTSGDFRIYNNAIDLGDGTIQITCNDDSSTITSGGVASINISKESRQVKRTGSWPNDYQATGATITVSNLEGADVILPAKARVYQLGATGEALADILSISTRADNINFPVDFELRGSIGANRIIIADCWDPSGSGENNTANISGELSLFIRPIQT